MTTGGLLVCDSGKNSSPRSVAPSDGNSTSLIMYRPRMICGCPTSPITGPRRRAKPAVAGPVHGLVGGDVLTRSCQVWAAFLGIARLNHALGGAVAVNDGRAAIWANQSHSFGCPGRQRRSGLRTSRPRAQPSVICTTLSAPCINAMSISASQRSAMRRLRCASCWRTVGDRSF